MAELSIIIPTSNSMSSKKNGLELVLLSIGRQSFSKQNTEIIFVDNDSQDDTTTFINKWIDENLVDYANLRLVHNHDSVNRSKSRNMGVEHAHGDKLLFIDDDTIIYNKNTLDLLTRRYYIPGLFFCGAQRYWTISGWDYDNIFQHLIKNSPIESIAFLPKGISRETGWRDLQEFSFIGNFGGLMKEDFLKIGGFDAVRFPGRQEDVDLMFRLVLNNFTYQQLTEDFKVIHLTHPIIASNNVERNFWIDEFKKREAEEGYYFCINHLFKVFEDNDTTHPVLKKIPVG